MPRAKKITPVDSEPRLQPPAQTLEARENQLILLATNLAEKQLREGTASSQVIAHYLKLGSTRERLEQERIRHENMLAQAKTESLEAQKQQEIEIREVMEAFRSYAGQDDGYDEYVD